MIKEAHENLITGKTFEVVILIRRFLELLNSHTYFCFLITYGVCKMRKYCDRISEKKKFSPFDEFSCFVCLRRQNKQKKSVCLSVCLSVRGLFLWTQ